MSAVLVIGGSGAVGGFLLARLRAAGHDILALSRTARTDAARISLARSVELSERTTERIGMSNTRKCPNAPRRTSIGGER